MSSPCKQYDRANIELNRYCIRKIVSHKFLEKNIMVHPGDNLPLQRSSRDHVDEGYSTPHQQSFIIPTVERRGSSDHLQPSIPSPGEIRSMFGTARICEYPEYQRPTSTVPDPTEWENDRHLDDLEEKLIKIQQWSEVPSNQQPNVHEGFREISRRDASHQLFRNSQPSGEILFSADFDAPRFFGIGCSSTRSAPRTAGESDDMSSTASQYGFNSYQQEDGIIRGSAIRKGSRIFTLNEDPRTLTSDERMVKYLLDMEEMNYEGTSHSKAKSLSKLCDIVQSLRRVYEDNKKACHVVKKMLEIFNLNDDINGKLEGDTKTILKEKFCRFLENSEPELDAYKDINKLFELLESGLTCDEESTLQSTLENLCIKLNPDLNCLQYEPQPVIKPCVPSEKELLTNEEDEVLIKLHNLSSDLSVTVFEEIDGKTSVVGQSLPKKNGPEWTTRKRNVTNIPVHLSRKGTQREHSLVKNQVAATDSNTSASLKQNMVLPRKNFGSYREELFKKAIALGFTKDVEELEKSSASLSRRSQLALLEKKVNGKYKSMHIAEERRKLGVPERISNYKPLIRKKPLDKALLSSSSSTMSNNVSSFKQQKINNLDVEEKVSTKTLGIKNNSNRRKIILDILPVLRQDGDESEKEVDNKETVLPEIKISDIAVVDDDVYYASNLANKYQKENNLSDDKTETSTTDASNDAAVQEQPMKDSEMDDKCFVKKTSSNNNRRKTIHAIVTVSRDLSSEQPQEYFSSNDENVGDENNKLNTSTEQCLLCLSKQCTALSSKESFTIIRSTLTEPIKPNVDESERVPVHDRRRNDHFITGSSLFFIIFTAALLYAVYLYGNFELSYDYFENYHKIMGEYLGKVKDNIYEYKESCCEVLAKRVFQN